MTLDVYRVSSKGKCLLVDDMVGMMASRSRAWLGLVADSGSTGSSSLYRVARRKDRRLKRDVAIESSRIRSTGSVLLMVGVVNSRGSCDHCARQIGQVRLPCRTFDAMHVK